MHPTAKLTLQSGEVFHGDVLHYLNAPIFGEVVFNTGMAGYVETLTDPSYAGQILVFTYPLIGNYGVFSRDTWESSRIQVQGVILSELCAFPSNYQSVLSLRDWLIQEQVACLSGIDTRSLTKVLREKGVIQGVITHSADTITEFNDSSKISLVSKTSIKEPVDYGAGDKTIILVDCGLKENILRSLLQFPVKIRRVPHDYDYTNESFAGVLVSNGPGDPTECIETIRILQKAMQLKKPIFGICLGTQLMALAANSKTYKLRFGHRSHNQPCLYLPTGRAYLTSQNHGYAIDEQSLTKNWRVTFRNLNDQSVAGIAHTDLPFFSVQFHPEASPGPNDTLWLFQHFYDLIAHT